LKILIFGSEGMVGSSISNILSKGNDYELVLSNRNTNNLFDLSSTKKHIKDVNPDCIINAAAKVGGININNEKRFEFITENLKINMKHKNAKTSYTESVRTPILFSDTMLNYSRGVPALGEHSDEILKELDDD